MIKRIKLWTIILISVLVLTFSGIVGFYIYENKDNVRDWSNGQVNVTNTQYVDLQNEYEKQIKNFLSRISNLENSLSSANGEIATYKADIQQKDSKIKQLQSTNESNLAKIKEYETQISQKDARIEELERNAQLDSDEKSALIQELQKEKQDLITQKSALETQVATNEQRISELESEIETKTSRISELEQTITEKTTEIEQLNSRVSDLQNQLKTKEQRISELETELQTTQQSLNQANSDLTDERENVSNLTSQLGTLQEENTQQKNKIQEYETQISQKDARIEELESNAEQNASEIAQLKQEKQQLEIEKSTLETQVEENTQTISSLQTELETKNSRISELEKEVADKTQEIATLNSTIGELREELNSQSGVDISVYVNKTFSENSYKVISAVSSFISACSMTSEQVASTFGWNIGDEIDILVGEETATMLILGFNHDDLSDGSGKAGITLGMKNLFSVRYAMNSSKTNVGGWDSCSMRTDTLVTLFSQFSADLQNVIKLVNKKSSVGNKETTVTTSNDKLWLLSPAEIYSKTAIENSSSLSFRYSAATYVQEGVQYDYYKNLISDKDPNDTLSELVKYQSNGTGSAYGWWLRSPYLGNVSEFCCIFNSGKLNSNSGGLSYASGVSFCFCI